MALAAGLAPEAAQALDAASRIASSESIPPVAAAIHSLPDIG